MYWNWTCDIAEIVSRNQLSKPHDNCVREQRLPPPELVKFGAIEWRRSRQAIVAGHHAGLLIGRLAIETKQGCADHSARNIDELAEIGVETGHEQIVEARHAGTVAAGGEVVSVADKHTAQPDAAVGAKTNKPSQVPCAGLNIDRAGVACYSLRCVLGGRRRFGEG